MAFMWFKENRVSHAGLIIWEEGYGQGMCDWCED